MCYIIISTPPLHATIGSSWYVTGMMANIAPHVLLPFCITKWATSMYHFVAIGAEYIVKILKSPTLLYEPSRIKYSVICLV